MNNVFGTVNVHRSPRYRQAAFAAIKEAILEGRIPAGEPLTETKIAAALGMSRTPVREALAILEHEGLICQHAGPGMIIQELSREEFIDMFVANELVEPQLVRRAAIYATPEHLAEIQRAIDIGTRAVESLDIMASLRSGREVHRWIGIAANNPPLARFVLQNEEKTDLYLLSLNNSALLTRDEMAISNQEHQDILDAIERRDPEDASRLVIYHAQSLRRRHQRFFSSSSDPNGHDRAFRNELVPSTNPGPSASSLR